MSLLKNTIALLFYSSILITGIIIVFKLIKPNIKYFRIFRILLILIWVLFFSYIYWDVLKNIFIRF